LCERTIILLEKVEQLENLSYALIHKYNLDYENKENLKRIIFEHKRSVQLLLDSENISSMRVKDYVNERDNMMNEMNKFIINLQSCMTV